MSKRDDQHTDLVYDHRIGVDVALVGYLGHIREQELWRHPTKTAPGGGDANVLDSVYQSRQPEIRDASSSVVTDQNVCLSVGTVRDV